ncbi:DUF4381 domain-containing protein [Photobacterium minamisatsumaniensis]|uniref:DUF4381 domain-containing protein n=1 Tax=Photobacterium minamisatsumaniensis TaxID=2910233 RepID=UPI003D09CF45
MANTDKFLSLAPLERAPEPSWWPLPLSAWVLIGGAVCIAVIVLAVVVWRHGRKQIKRKALHQLSGLAIEQDLSSLDNLLRRVALTYFPRNEVAGLTGEAWLKWLDTQLVTPQFLPLSSQWSAALYRGNSLDNCQWNTCIAASQQWITQLKTEAKC